MRRQHGAVRQHDVDGRFQEQALWELLTGGQYPARNPKQNIADLKAQAAANEKGVQQLYAMVDHFCDKKSLV